LKPFGCRGGGGRGGGGGGPDRGGGAGGGGAEGGPCGWKALEFLELWHPGKLSELGEAKRGISEGRGPGELSWWNVADAGLVRAIWGLNGHFETKENVVEGPGVSSRCHVAASFLEALKRNGEERLIFGALIFTDGRFCVKQIRNCPLGGGLSDRWTYIKGRVGASS